MKKMAKPIYHIMTFSPHEDGLKSLDELVTTLKHLPLSIGIAKGYELPINAYFKTSEKPILEVDTAGTILTLTPQR